MTQMERKPARQRLPKKALLAAAVLVVLAGTAVAAVGMPGTLRGWFAREWQETTGSAMDAAQMELIDQLTRPVGVSDTQNGTTVTVDSVTVGDSTIWMLLKVSGEALAGAASRGLDFDVIGGVCDVVKKCVEAGVQIGIVVGGGNFWRGVKDGGDRMERTRADHMGMLATCINALAVADCLEQRGVEVRVQTAIAMNQIAEPYIRSKAIRHLEKNRVVIFGCGTGNPFFSTDTGAVLRAAEINADAILLAKNIDGVYSADPAKDPTAVKYDEISYDEVLAKHLAVMDSTATSLSMDNHIPVQVFALKDPENILRVVMGEKIGTIVKEEL